MFNAPNDYFASSQYHPEFYPFDHTGSQLDAPPGGFKRRVSANKKERRRTHSINTAFSDLRTAIPNVQPDTKLSKIKTLRLATKYIEYLLDILSRDDSTAMPNAFKAEIIRTRKDHRFDDSSSKLKARTGWPQTVWQSELNLHQYDSSSREMNF